ncbi:cold shock domain-containing protein [Streptomyces sp. NBC_00654]|uniref:cold shock domain-containing protein n=1 Tax=Streptomyces sp. NBC_00654 TaxID=2975799 RepID=UPI00224E5D72|nr:cold shock domain-containing protein [Streptomyces sp. NBC_00654]MCX4967572.1 cold shock domain-containing protein [Streptomyces sp. NBC_00654]
MSERCEGIVQFYSSAEGYGFVVPHGRKEPLYLTADDIDAERRVLSEGQLVSFVIELGQGRFVARNVRP